ncbi:MAG: hypothetical protein KF901_31225 [Myxococcales bacterium]|nr:hypothetical protein [Myxococcales bacterium]
MPASAPRALFVPPPRDDSPTRVPAVAHFIWFGARFPWVNALAIRSAMRLGGFSRVVLHADRPFEALEGHEALLDLPSEGAAFEARELAPESLFAEVERVTASRGVPVRLGPIWAELDKPAARANVVRAAILLTEGGVYLDTDTITVRSLRPLLEAHGAFCGLEHIALPGAVARSRSPVAWAGVGMRMGARDLLRRLPGGWRHFRAIERFYPAAANNAVLGAAAAHPFVADLVGAMTTTPAARRTVRFALGTHLLQERLALAPPGQIEALPPRTFYPFGPEISEHWFRDLGPRVDIEGAVREALAPETFVVHWYASVRTAAIVPQIEPAWVAQHRDRQLFSAIASRALGLDAR